MEESLNHLGAEFLNFAGGMLWQASLLIAVVFAADLALARRLRASVRHALWLVVLVKLLLPPTLALPTSVAWWLFPAKPIVLPAAVPEAKASNVKTSVVVFDDVPAADLAQEPVPVVEPPRVKLNGAGWMLVGTGLVSAGLLAWLVVRWLGLVRTVRKASSGSGGPRSGLDVECLKRPGPEAGAPRLRVRVVEAQMSPAVFGLFRPVILLPRLLAEKLSPEQLRAVLLHELIHVRRGDVWVNCAQSLLQIFYWWHPLVWLANARMRRVREEAVDDAVMVALGEQADTYAPTLLEVAKLAFRRPLLSLGILGLIGIIESRSALRQRVERLLDFRAPRRAGITFLSFCGIFLFSVVALPMGQGPAPIVKAPVPENERVPAQEPPVTPIAQPRPSSVLLSSVNPSQLDIASQNFAANLVTNLVVRTFRVSQESMREAFKNIDQSRFATPSAMARALFSQMGVDMLSPPGKSVFYNDRLGLLFVKATESDLDTIEHLLQVISARTSATPMPQTTSTEASREIDTTNFWDDQTSMLLLPLSEERQTQKKTMVFITATRVDPPGSRLYPDGDMPFAMNAVPAQPTETTDNSSQNSELDPTQNPQSVAPKQNVATTNKLIYTGAGRTAIMAKLDHIHLDQISYDGIPLSEALKQLSQQCRLSDPEHKGINFLINSDPDPADQPSATTNEQVNVGSYLIKIPTLTNIRLADLLDAIVLVSDHPLKYSVHNFAIIFSAKRPQIPPLFIRTFLIDTNLFYRRFGNANLQHLPSDHTDGIDSPDSLGGHDRTVATPPAATPNVVLREFIKSLGIDLLNPPGKTVFFSYKNSDKKGTLFVKATEADLDTIEGALAGLNVEEQEKISEKLDRIHLLNVSFESVRLKDVVRQLGEMSVQADPEKTGVRIFTAFNSASSGGTNIDSVIIKMPTLSAARLVDVLDEIVLAADQPINYSIRNDGVVFFNDNSRGFAPVTVLQGRSTAIRAPEPPNRLVTQSTRPPFVDGGTPFPRGQGALVPRIYPDFLTENSRETERQLMSQTVQGPGEPLQVHIKARFIAVPKGLATGLGQFLNTTNSKDGRPMGIFSNRELKAALQLLQAQPGAETLAEPEITVLSGRQSEMKGIQTISVITNLVMGNQLSNPKTNFVEVGAILDVVPYALADGYSIRLDAIPSLREFLVYDSTNSRTGPIYQSGGPRPKVSPISTSGVATANVWDNQTLLVTGLDEYLGATEPPLFGRFFDADHTKYKDIYIFITATLVDSTGSRIHSDTDLIALPPVPPQPK